MEKVLGVFSGLVRGIREINEKYKTPEIEMTPFVRLSLLLLRVYLFSMVGILLIKFITLVLPH